MQSAATLLPEPRVRVVELPDNGGGTDDDDDAAVSNWLTAGLASNALDSVRYRAVVDQDASVAVSPLGAAAGVPHEDVTPELRRSVVSGTELACRAVLLRTFLDETVAAVDKNLVSAATVAARVATAAVQSADAAELATDPRAASEEPPPVLGPLAYTLALANAGKTPERADATLETQTAALLNATADWYARTTLYAEADGKSDLPPPPPPDQLCVWLVATVLVAKYATDRSVGALAPKPPRGQSEESAAYVTRAIDYLSEQLLRDARGFFETALEPPGATLLAADEPTAGGPVDVLAHDRRRPGFARSIGLTAMINIAEAVFFLYWFGPAELRTTAQALAAAARRRLALAWVGSFVQLRGANGPPTAAYRLRLGLVGAAYYLLRMGLPLAEVERDAIPPEALAAARTLYLCDQRCGRTSVTAETATQMNLLGAPMSGFTKRLDSQMVPRVSVGVYEGYVVCRRVTKGDVALAVILEMTALPLSNDSVRLRVRSVDDVPGALNYGCDYRPLLGAPVRPPLLAGHIAYQPSAERSLVLVPNCAIVETLTQDAISDGGKALDALPDSTLLYAQHYAFGRQQQRQQPPSPAAPFQVCAAGVLDWQTGTHAYTLQFAPAPRLTARAPATVPRRLYLQCCVFAWVAADASDVYRPIVAASSPTRIKLAHGSGDAARTVWVATSAPGLLYAHQFRVLSAAEKPPTAPDTLHQPPAVVAYVRVVLTLADGGLDLGQRRTAVRVVVHRGENPPDKEPVLQKPDLSPQPGLDSWTKPYAATGADSGAAADGDADELETLVEPGGPSCQISDTMLVPVDPYPAPEQTTLGKAFLLRTGHPWSAKDRPTTGCTIRGVASGQFRLGMTRWRSGVHDYSKPDGAVD